METKTELRKALEECWHYIQKSYDSIQNGLSMLEHAEIRVETLLHAETGAQAEPDRLGFGEPASEASSDSKKARRLIAT